MSNKEAYLELAREAKVYPMPQAPSPQTQERQPAALQQRHAAYSDMLDHLTLLDRHGENLLERGLSEERIRENGYKSMPETERGRRLIKKLSQHVLLITGGGTDKFTHVYDVIHIRVVPFYGEMSHQFLMTSGSLSYCPEISSPHS